MASFPDITDRTPPQVISRFEADFAVQRRKLRIAWAIGTAVFLACLILTAALSDFFKIAQVTMPDGSREWRWVIAAGLPRLGEYVEKTLPLLRRDSLFADVGAWFWRFDIWMQLLLETILIAFVATTLGVVAGFVLAFPASRNLAPNRWVYWACRRYLEIARTVPDLVFALIFVFCFAVGPLAGVLAIALHTTGALGKLYSEAIENIDMRPLDGIKSAGGSWFDQIRYAAVPQVLPNVISYTLLRFEINVRSSSIIGYVGAGGLGQEFRVAMSLQEYQDLSALFLIILVTVTVIDFASEKLRHHIIGTERT